MKQEGLPVSFEPGDIDIWIEIPEDLYEQYQSQSQKMKEKSYQYICSWEDSWEAPSESNILKTYIVFLSTWWI